MKIRINSRKYPTGVTSLLVVVGISLVFVIMVTGLTALSIREARQSSDTDLSNRALASALAANNAASELLTTYPNIQVPNCDGSGAANLPSGGNVEAIIKPSDTSSSDNSVEVICRTIKSEDTTIEESINQDEFTQIYTYLPTNTVPPNTMELKWGNTSNNPLPSSYQEFTSYGNTTPAALEVTVVSWSSSTLTNPKDVAGGLTNKTTLIVPTSTPKDFIVPSAIASSPSPSCTTGTAYKCSVTVDLNTLKAPGTDRIIVQLKPRFNNASFAASFKNSSGNIINVQSSRATIDTTAKVGSLSRRIRSFKNLYGNSFVGDVVFSNGNICKNLRVSDTKTLIAANNCP